MSGVEIVTFGCRLNAFESGVIARAAAAAGLEDAVIVNTCAVTAEAERQARQAIRRARRERPGARIIVTGCAAQLSPERYAALPEVDRVLGNAEKLLAESYAAERAPPEGEDPLPTARNGPLPPTQENPLPPAGGEGRVRGAAQAVRAPLTPPLSPRWGEREKSIGESGNRATSDRVRAYLQVQQGCDHRCTFCIIPYARGPSRSLPLAEIAGAARRLVAEGSREVVLTGVDLTAYGADLPAAPRLGQMLRRLLAEVPELARLRLSSLDPAEIDDELWAVLASEERLMPHLHLSLQSGDDLILKRMKRRHSRAQAIAAARRAHDLRPELALGADLIAGFPTESEDMFRRSLDLIEECGLAFVHVFPYSPRPGTAAARMPQLPGAVVRERAARLRERAAAALTADLAGRVGSTTQVLVEQPGRGRAAFYAPVALDRAVATGTLLPVRLAAAEATQLAGVPL